jgi:aminopeptidase-like protein
MKSLEVIMKWANDLFPLCRSITGEGLRKSLKYLKKIVPEMKLKNVKSGEKFFDWEIPLEWNINDSYIYHIKSKKKFAEFSKNNLHIMGYSEPINKKIKFDDLKKKIFFNKKYPNQIPYVTSYYKRDWAFSMSYNQFIKMPKGDYRVVIDSKLSKGKMDYGEVLIKGKLKKEIFFSTYLCHPSLANNELSGPLFATYLIRQIKKKFKNTKFSYRFVFIPETIGSIFYIKKNLKILKKNMVAGYTISCVGDNKNYSHIESRIGNTLADQSLEASFINLRNIKKYPFLVRGSDERQYCAPGVDLPVAGFCRTKYGSYPEYHSSEDNLSLINKKGFEGTYNVIMNIIKAFELGLYPQNKIKCEPMMSKRNLYYATSDEENINKPVMGYESHPGENLDKIVTRRMDILAYSDGQHNIFEISKIINEPLKEVVKELEILSSNNLIKFVN